MLLCCSLGGGGALLRLGGDGGAGDGGLGLVSGLGVRGGEGGKAQLWVLLSL